MQQSDRKKVEMQVDFYVALMETVPHPSSTLLSIEENDVFADFYGIFNSRRDGMPFLTNPHVLTCASCRIYDFWDHEKLVTKLEDILVPNKRPLQAKYSSRGKAAKGRK